MEGFSTYWVKVPSESIAEFVPSTEGPTDATTKVTTTSDGPTAEPETEDNGKADKSINAGVRHLGMLSTLKSEF